jgi:nucleoside-diphosphate-sugar epimerase
MVPAQRLAITGANGFLGRNVIRCALARGWHVNAIVRRQNAVRGVEALGAKTLVVPQLEADALRLAFAGCRAVVHVAGIARATNESFEVVNVGGARAVLEAAEAAGLSRVITPSGLGVHLVGKAAWADNDYFRSKLRVEEVVLAAKVASVLFRPSYILGPGDELIPNLVKALKTGVVVIAGEGKTSMQPVFVGDAANAFVAAAEGRGPDRATYDLVGPETSNMLALVELVSKAMQSAGVTIPPTRFEHVPWDQAGKRLGLSPDEIGVMQCDYLGDPAAGPRALGYALSSLERAVRAAVTPEIA